MSRTFKWGLAVAAGAASFVGTLVLAIRLAARVLPDVAASDQLVVAVGCATAVSAPVGLCGAWWAGRERQGPQPAHRRTKGLWRWLITAVVLSVVLAAAVGVRLTRPLPAGPGLLVATIALLSALGAVNGLVQYRRGRRRLPMPLPEDVLRVLDTQRSEAESYPYRFQVPIPAVSTMYVERSTEFVNGGRPLDAGPVTVLQMLERSRHVVLVADAGGGKSMLAAKIAGESSAWWLGPRQSNRKRAAPYGRVIATYIPARLLVGTKMADALAAYWSRPTGKVSSATFLDRPAQRVDWLIFVDGVDEIADTGERSRVLLYLRDEVMDSASPYRIVVTSRSLPPSELGAPRADVYRLRPFGPDDLRDFALRWFSERGRPTGMAVQKKAWEHPESRKKLLIGMFMKPLRKHWIVLVNGLWLPTLFGLVGLFVAFALPISIPQEIRVLVTVIVVLIWGAWAAVVYLQWSAAQLTVTDQSVILEEGIFTRRSKVIPLDRVQDVSTKLSLVGRMLNYGLVEIDVANVAGAERFEYARGPEMLRDKFFVLSEQLRLQEETRRFLELVDNARLTAMVRVPLLATMAVLIYEFYQQVGLPTTRTKLYQQFVELLQSDSMPGRGKRPLSPPFDGWLLDVPDGEPDLLRALADAQLGGDHNLLRVAFDWVHAHQHAGSFVAVTDPGLASQVTHELIASSLFTMGGGQPSFLHQSLAEYVAATPRGKDFDTAAWYREIASSVTRSLALFRLGRSNQDPEPLIRELSAADPVAAGHVLADGVMVSADLRLRVVDQLIAGGLGDGATRVEAVRLAAQFAVDPIIWDRLVERTVLDPDAPGWDRAVLADALAEIDQEKGLPLLRQIAEEVGTLDPEAAIWVASRLTARRDELGRRIFEILTVERPLLGDLLSGLPDLRRQAYEQTILDHRQPAGMRLRAAVTLAVSTGLTGVANLDVVRELIAGPRLSPQERVWGGRILAITGDKAGIGALRSIALDSKIAAPERQQAAATLDLCGVTDDRVVSAVQQGVASEAARVSGSSREEAPGPRWLQAMISFRRYAHSRAIRSYAASLQKIYASSTDSFGGHQDSRRAYVSQRVVRQTGEELLDDALLGRHERWILLGSDGAGKTWLLRHLLLKWADIASTDWQIAVFPVYVQLREYDGESSFEELILASLRRDGLRCDDRFIHEALSRGELFVMWDGLDEVAAERRSRVVVAIERFALAYPACGIVVTCATEAYKGDLARVFEQEISLVGFDDAGIRSFLAEWSEFQAQPTVDRLFASLNEDPLTMELARNPLMLTMIANLFNSLSARGMQISRPRLLQQVVEVGIRRGAVSGAFDASSDRAAAKVLRRLALVLCDSSDVHLPGELAVNEIQRLLPSMEEREAWSLFDNIAQSSGLLRRVEEGRGYRFSHLAIQQYLAAAELSDDPKGLLKRLERDKAGWREPVRLWCGLARDCSPVVEQVLADDPFLAYECLVEAEKIDLYLAKHTVEATLDLAAAGGGGTRFGTSLGRLAARPHNEWLSDLLMQIALSPGDKRRLISYAALVALGSPHAAHILATSATEDPHAREALGTMGLAAVPELASLAAEEDARAVDLLADMAAPSAVAELARLLWTDGPAARRAGLRTTILLVSPDTPADLVAAVLSGGVSPTANGKPPADVVTEPRLAAIVRRISELLSTR